MKKAIKLSLAAALAGGAMLQAADVDINGYRGGSIDLMLKAMTVIDDEKNGFAPSNGSGYLVKLKYETPDVWLDGLKVGVGMYVNGDAGLTEWDEKGAPTYDKGAYGMVVDVDGESKALMGEFYLSYKHQYFDAKFGRQTLDTPLTKINTSLMPNFYEAYMLGTNVIEGLRLTAGQITKMSLGSRAAPDWGIIGENTGTAGVAVNIEQLGGDIEQAKFYNMGTIAGKDSTAGRTVIGATYTGIKNLKADFWVYHSDDIANDIYAEVGYKIPVSEGMAVNLNAQYLMQKDTGDSLAGERDFNMFGAKVALGTKKWGVFAAYNQSGKKDDLGANQEGQYFNAWGADPAYTSSIFSRNAYREDVDAYKVGAHYVIMKGLRVSVDYANYGKSASSAGNVAALTKLAMDDAYEVDIGVNYRANENWFFRVFNARRVSEFNGTTPSAFDDHERRQNHYRAVAVYNF
ncbi:OprD family outer membrane porin [Sulfurimonas sp.]|uniref:OprD family outer membrane porin n=1 Tax=Sulfurimonas sp. TaxID=2022749 RepID=UPI0019E87991|nr:OprD family outer membrane porin [Sulfurimonas sp.]MBE0513367.1 outer membrane porin, OprD family [Sulfurimonas sp.]